MSSKKASAKSLENADTLNININETFTSISCFEHCVPQCKNGIKISKINKKKQNKEAFIAYCVSLKRVGRVGKCFLAKRWTSQYHSMDLKDQ